MDAAIGAYSMTYGYRIGESNQNLEAKRSIRDYLNKYKMKEYKETPLLDHFQEISQIIADANY